MSESPLHLRVFLSSPGDVAMERSEAREVLQSLHRQPLLRGRVSLEAVSYDDPDAPSPMAVHETPQDSVNRFTGRPADCDLTVVILWSRLGTPLPAHLRRPDGTPFESGTLWEWEDARQADREVWVYRRTEIPTLELTDPEFDRKRAEYRAVEVLFQKFRHSDGSLHHGFNAYPRAGEFRELFEKHLESFVRSRLEAADGARSPASSPDRGGKSGGASTTDLGISDLKGPWRARPLSGHPVLTLPGPGSDTRRVFAGGVQVSFTLTATGEGRDSISLYALELELLSFTAGPQPDLAYTIEGAEIQGAGMARPHVFSVTLQGTQVGRASWVVDGRKAQVERATSANFLDTSNPMVLTFRGGQSEIEELQGTVLALETGLYEFRFVFHYSVAGEDRRKPSAPIRVYFDE